MKRRTDHYASYKDPSAKVFFLEEEEEFIFRELAPSYSVHYQHLKNSGLSAELIRKKWLIDFEEQQSSPVILKSRKISFVCYPYEWTFSQWKEAALLTMKIQYQALKFGMFLKDATPFNIVFDGATPVFVDVSSFEIYKEGNPWVALKQFSENLYLPLLLYKYFDAIANDLYLNNSNGIPVSRGLSVLPARAHLNLNTIFYLTLPEKIRRKTINKAQSKQGYVRKFSQKDMLNLADQLFVVIGKLKQSSKLTKWNDYYHDCYKIDQDYLVEKKKTIHEWLVGNYSQKTLIDVGCNTGNFSLLVADLVKSIIAFDEDSRSVDELYRHCRQNKITNIFCFTANFSAPTPAIGWNNNERPKLLKRLNGDVTLALALVHHLAICSYISFEMMAPVFASMSNELIIEFVPPHDEKVILLMAGRIDTFKWYNRNEFLKAFEHFFKIIKIKSFQNNRELFHFIKKVHA